ncbi:MAG: DUF308 domain-containing protein [Gammaproteobacteria bacterium]|nr:DUF308 domain-containing protein [Gammaproteobacteria bacterium]
MTELANIIRIPSRIGTGWGFAVVLLGVIAILTPFLSGMAVSGLLAVVVMAAGVAMTVYAFKAGSFGKGLLQFLFGGITIIAGFAMFLQPFVSLWSLTAVLMAWFLIDGTVSIITGIRAKGEAGWAWVIFSGVASVVLAVLLWREWPDSGTYAVGLLVGIRLIFSGWSIAMLGMAGDTAVDMVDEAVQAKLKTSKEQQAS